MRAGRVWAVAWRDLATVHAGRSRWGLPLLALGLLLPVGAVPLELSIPRPDAQAALHVAGEIPAALQERLVADPQAPVRLEGAAPVRVVARSLPSGLRAALDTLGGPVVRVQTTPLALKLPGRSLLVALLAISLLTGPLAESLPGERSRGTLEVLLTAAISRIELVTGKWLAWTLWGGAASVLAAVGGMMSGAQAPGLWPLALPLVSGTAVALGLWLVRGAADVVGGAAIPMRVVPAIAIGLAGLAWGLSAVDPLLGAAVPLGGALLVAGAVITGPAALVAAALGSGLATAWLLRRTASDIETSAQASRAGVGAVVLAVAGLWGLAVAGPGVWAIAGNAAFDAPVQAGLLAGGACLSGLAAVVCARDAVWPAVGAWRGWVVGLVGAALLWGGSRLSAGWTWDAGPMAPMVERLAMGLGGASGAGMLAVALGQEWVFRDLLRRRVGEGWALMAWVLVVGLANPILGLWSGIVLTGLARRWGLGAAVVASLGWMALV